MLSSQKSTAGSKTLLGRATSAADRTFAAPPASPHDEAGGTGANVLHGRRRLAGAYFIEIDRIRPDPAQPRRRLDTEAQEELVHSVRQLGVMQPISVRFLEAQDAYQIISGERRYHAAVTAGLAELPCWVQTPREEEVLLRQVVENWQRKDLSPFELADALAAIRDAHGYSQKELTDLTGKPKSEISKLLALLTLSPDAQQTARQDATLSRRHLYAISQARPEEHAALLAEVQRRGLKAEDAETLARRSKPTAAGDRRRGTLTTVRRFTTSSAIVTVTFRKRTVEDEDITAALDEARQQLDQPKGGMSQQPQRSPLSPS